MNFLLRTDSYKFTHWKQYPPNTTAIYSYLESRGGMFPASVFFGLQYYLKAYVQGPVFTKQDITQADEFCRQHFGRDLFNRHGWTRLLQKHGGCLPVRIRAVPEGSVVSNLNVLATIENTDPDFPWLTNYLETLDHYRLGQGARTRRVPEHAHCLSRRPGCLRVRQLQHLQRV